MALGNKIAALFLTLGIAIAFGSFIAIKLSVFPAFEDFEIEWSQANMDRVERALDGIYNELAVVNREYAHWNDTMQFALGNPQDYVEENLDDGPYWSSLDIHLVAIFDTEGRRLWGMLLDPVTGDRLDFDNDLVDPLTPDHPLVRAAGEAAGSGYLPTAGAPLITTSEAILTTFGEGPPAGRFVIGRYLDARQIAELGRRVSTNVQLVPFEAARHESLAVPSDTNRVRHMRTPDDVVTSTMLRDVRGEPLGVIEVRTPRRISAIGARVISVAMTLTALMTSVFLLASVVFLRRLIVSPVVELTEQIARIRTTGELAWSSDAYRRDEIGKLRSEFGQMTDSLAAAQGELERTRDLALAASRAKSEFLARMSHEIRTPMNGALGMTELLRNTALSPKQRRFTDAIGSSTETLLAIINDILDFSKIEAGKIEVECVDFDVREVVEDILDNVATPALQEKLELVNAVSPALPRTLRGDPLRLRQVLTNLVANALKFTSEGEIVVRVASEDNGDDSYDVHFRIADTGVGIALEKQRVVFDSFSQEDGTTTRQYGGTGLGLPISKQLVELMGGELTLESTPGEGAEFSFTLRMRAGESPAEPTATLAQELVGKRILIVDDTATNREILEEQLGGCYARTGSAASAEDALTVLDEALRSGSPYELAILDVHMPAVDGIELARRIREKEALNDLQVVFLSSVAAQIPEQTLRDLNVAEQLSKPIRQSRLVDAVSSVLSARERATKRATERVFEPPQLLGRVLLVEDNAINQAIVLGMLETMDIEAEVATNGEEAVALVESSVFDVVLMDCQMPIMDGYTASRAIRSFESESGREPVTIIALTADAMKGDREKCLDAGMTDYLAKPFTLEQLGRVLGSTLTRAEPATVEG